MVVDAAVCPLYVGEKLWTILPSAHILQQHVKSFEDFPPRQAPPGFGSEQLLDGVMKAANERQGNWRDPGKDFGSLDRYQLYASVSGSQDGFADCRKDFRCLQHHKES